MWLSRRVFITHFQLGNSFLVLDKFLVLLSFYSFCFIFPLWNSYFSNPRPPGFIFQFYLLNIFFSPWIYLPVPLAPACWHTFVTLSSKCFMDLIVFVEEGNLGRFLGICLQFFGKNVPPFSFGRPQCRRQVKTPRRASACRIPCSLCLLTIVAF